MPTTIEIDLHSTDIAAAVRHMLAAAGIHSLAEVARQLGFKVTTLRAAVNTGQLRLKDFLHIAELCGFQVIVRNGDEKSGVSNPRGDES